MEKYFRFAIGKAVLGLKDFKAVPVLMIALSIFIQGMAVGVPLDIESDEQINPSSTEAPEWSIGDWWNYTFQYNSTVDEHEWGNDWMYLDGDFNRTVEGTEKIIIDEEVLDCYVVEHERHYEVEGLNHDEGTGFNITMNMTGFTTGREYFDTETLELVTASYETNMTGISEVVEFDIELDVYVDDKTEMDNTLKGDFYSFPIDPEEVWESQSEYTRSSRSWTNITGMDNEYEEEDYPVDHDYHTISVPNVGEKEVGAGVFDAFYIEAEHTWSVNESEERYGIWEKYYSNEVGNLVYVNMTEVYHDAFGMNVTYGHIELMAFSHTPSQPAYRFSVDVDSTEKTVRPGGSVKYVYDITNEGDLSDTYYVEIVQGNEWGTLNKTEFHLEPSDSETVLLNVSVPSDADTGEYDHIVEFTSESEMKETIDTITEVIPLEGDIRVNTETTKESVLAGNTAEYIFNVKNRYEQQIDVYLEMVEDGSGWASIDDETITLNPDEEKDTNLNVNVPDDAEEGTYMDILRFTTDTDMEVLKYVNTSVEVQNYDFEAVAHVDTKDILQGEKVDYNLSVENTGDVEDTLSIDVESSIHLELYYPDEIEVEEQEDFTVSVSTGETPAGNYDISVTMTSMGDADVYKEIQLDLTVKEKEYSIDVEVDSTHRQTYVDASLDFLFNVRNRGNVEDTIVVSNEDDWTTLTDVSMDLAPSERKECSLQVKVPEDAESGEYTFEVIFRSKGDADVEEKIQLTISVQAGVPYGVPTWNKGDSWTYRYHLNASSSSIEEMYQEGTLILTVEDEETLYTGDEAHRVYNVSYRRTSHIEGVTDQGGAVGNVDFDMDGLTTGNLYYRKRDLEILKGEFRNYMEGISIAVGVEIDINITDTSHMQAIFSESLFNTPIELGDSWEREAVYNRYSDMYTTFDPSGSPYPDDEHEEKEYEIEHTQSIEATSEFEYSNGEDVFDVVELAGTDSWTFDDDEETQGNFRKYYSRDVGNFVYYDMEDMFDQQTGLSVFDKRMVLVDHDHQHSEIDDHDIDVYAEEETKYCRPGDEVTYVLNVRNTGRYDDLIGLELVEEGWTNTLEKEYMELGSGSSGTVELILKVPDDYEVDSNHSIKVLVSSMSQPQINRIIELTVCIRESFKPVISGTHPPVREMTRIKGGDDISFSIDVHSLDGRELMTSWYVNGELVHQGDDFEFSPDKSGEYTITSRVTNGGEESTASWDVSVREPSSTNPILYVMIGILILAIALIAGFLYYRKKKKHKKEEASEEIKEEGGGSR